MAGCGRGFCSSHNLPVKIKDGFKNDEFLLDSGAVISILPPEMAKPMGFDLAFLQTVS
jgi:hypothetical protein